MGPDGSCGAAAAQEWAGEGAVGWSFLHRLQAVLSMSALFRRVAPGRALSYWQLVWDANKDDLQGARFFCVGRGFVRRGLRAGRAPDFYAFVAGVEASAWGSGVGFLRETLA